MGQSHPGIKKTDLGSPECSSLKALGKSQPAFIKPSFNRLVWPLLCQALDGSRDPFQPRLLLCDAMIQLHFLTVNNL